MRLTRSGRSEFLMALAAAEGDPHYDFRGMDFAKPEPQEQPDWPGDEEAERGDSIDDIRRAARELKDKIGLLIKGTPEMDMNELGDLSEIMSIANRIDDLARHVALDAAAERGRKDLEQGL